ncbi:related to het-6-heterokaryon incompatibility protein [Aspergillus terreus]|uniref:Related to het-6-heterokaryon incompatibility protein n=1 Tax=Aspergillus terreus TaxID=33178 RepID=A0A5M3Z9T1_ASPTE|nr:hypothetical protein ATETN484_0012034800 [Aspergillus terreus]GFF19596.1 related to het-6-heterokaryon incompatibility protein [Aspergillus terreus]
MASTHKPTQPLAVIENEDEELQFESEDYAARVAYSYSVLPGPRSFRLLVLLPGPPGSPLQCKLETHDLDGPDVADSYTAISYTWNPSIFDQLCVTRRRIPITHGIYKRFAIRHPIWCNGTRLLVSTNLYRLLRRLRDPTKAICLWVDALCINQDDLGERAVQVLLMKDIYSRAYNVLLWLGEEDETTEKGYALARKLAHHPDANPDLKVTCSIPMSGADLVTGSGLPRLGLPPIDAPDWEAFYRLFTRPVFKRSWIIQEVTFSNLPPFAQCGSHMILLSELVGAMAFLSSCGWRDLMAGQMEKDIFAAHNYAHDIMRVRTDVAYGRSQPHISVSLRFEASDPRDKIYAMLGVLPLSDMPAESRALLQPDYHKPVHTVYRDATIGFMAADGHLAVLSLAGKHSGMSGISLPSWVPDYSTENEEYSSLIGFDPSSTCHYKASSSETPGWASVPGQPNLLSLRVYRVDTVNMVSLADAYLIEETQLLEWTSMIRTLPRTYGATGEEVEEVLWRTLIGNRGLNRLEKTFDNEEEMREGFKDFLCAKTARLLNRTNKELVSPRYELFVSGFMYNMIGRRFFLTRSGLMGMGPPSIRAGDTVYMIAGAQVPFVFRQSSTNNAVWSLIGDCYVHGIMQGECLSRKGFAWQEITVE